MRNTKGQFVRGHSVPLKWRTASSVWHTGKLRSASTKKKISQNNAKYWLGKKLPEYMRKKVGNSLNGYRHSEATKKKIAISNRGRISYWRGKHNPSVAGKKNWNWKGGIYPFMLKIRDLLEYTTWRKKVFEKNSFRCVICKVPGGWSKTQKKKIELEADHIKAFSVIVRENNVKSLEDARNCQELWDLKNGRTLCRECHKKTETYGGKSRNATASK